MKMPKLRRLATVAAVSMALPWTALADQSKPAVPKLLPTAEDQQLAERTRALIDQAGTTPGREAANFLRNGWPKHMVSILSSTEPVEEPRLEQARKVVRDLSDTVAKGLDWPKPMTVTVPRVATAPTIDGVLEPSWQQAATFTKQYQFNSDQAATDAPPTTYRVMYDQDNLYFAFEVSDPNILAPEIERDGHVYNHDCVELFIQSEPDLPLYWEIVISPVGSIYDALNAKHLDNWGGIAYVERDVQGLRHAIVVNGTANNPEVTDIGYVVEIAVPFNQLPGYTRGNAPAAGDQLRFLMIRFNRASEDKISYYCFQPLLSWGHNIWNYATMVLGE